MIKPSIVIVGLTSSDLALKGSRQNKSTFSSSATWQTSLRYSKTFRNWREYSSSGVVIVPVEFRLKPSALWFTSFFGRNADEVCLWHFVQIAVFSLFRSSGHDFLEPDMQVWPLSRLSLISKCFCLHSESVTAISLKHRCQLRLDSSNWTPHWPHPQI